MNVSPYSIYYKHRPFRVAFLVSQKDEDIWIDEIFQYNNKKWGGRFNAIFLTDGNTISDEWWSFLREFDPDIIKSTVPLTDELKKKIYTFLTPLSIEIEEAPHKYISISNDPIDILPTKDNVAEVARDILGNQSSLVLFEVNESTPEIIKKFLNRNFGLIKTHETFSSVMERAMGECNVQIYKITNYESLNTALLDLSKFQNRSVFPIQICSLLNKFREPKRCNDSEKFTVIVGDSLDDLTYFWNRVHFIPHWMRTSFTHLWIPRDFTEEEKIQEGLEKFINRYTGRTGNNHAMNLVSFSLKEDELQKINHNFKFIQYSRTVEFFYNVRVPEYGVEMPFTFLRNDVEFFRARSNEEHLILEEPKVREGGIGGQYWFTDLFIQFRPERFTNISGTDYWWQVPRRHTILSDLRFFNKPARINKYNSFSLLMKRSHQFNPGSNIVTVKLPEDGSVFLSLICGESFDCYSQDEKTGFLSRPYYYAQRSDQGKYLTGVLSLFSNLLDAYSVFEERFWRSIFKKMSNQSDSRDTEQKRQIIQTLKKTIERGRKFNEEKEEDVDWLASKVLTLSKNYSRKENDLTFNEIMKEAILETEEYGVGSDGVQIPFEQTDLKNRISNLLEYGVFSLGLKPRCPTCGYKVWYSIDDVKQSVTCRGCGWNYHLDAEEVWYYRLNSLVMAAVSVHGTIPVLLVLGQLMHDARTSFLYCPSMELLNKDGEEFIAEAEIDLLCIKDGKFIIGEIKQSVSLFGNKDFEKIEKVAKLIKPDQIVFSALDEEPSPFVIRNIEMLRSNLSHLEIEVIWYRIHPWCLKPAPVR